MHWHRVVVQVTAEQLDDLEATLWDLGAVSVTVTDPEDNPIYEPPPGETPLWDTANVAGLFEETEDLPGITGGIEEAGYPVLYTEEIADRLWEREWMAGFEPMKFGRRLWVCPTGFEVDAEDATIIQLDPGLAFGTGTHATTRMCLEWLDANDLAGKRVLDFGCGSGILGIAALLLGAGSVVGIDTDPQALTATRDNAERNGVSDRLETSLPGEHPTGYDVVLANILAKPLIDLAPLLSDAMVKGGRLVLSGILDSQQSWVESAYEGRIILTDEAHHDGWTCLHGRR